MGSREVKAAEGSRRAGGGCPRPCSPRWRASWRMRARPEGGARARPRARPAQSRCSVIEPKFPSALRLGTSRRVQGSGKFPAGRGAVRAGQNRRGPDAVGGHQSAFTNSGGPGRGRWHHQRLVGGPPGTPASELGVALRGHVPYVVGGAVVVLGSAQAQGLGSHRVRT